MRGIKIPQQDFALKRQGGAYVRERGGGDVFAGHYGNLNKISVTYIVDTRASTNLLIDSI